MQTRRSVLCDALRLSAGFAIGSTLLQAEAAEPVAVLSVGSEPWTKLPADFMGLGYEMSSVAHLGLLSAGNRRYVNLVRGLGSEGVLRVGGIVADYTRYEPNGIIKANEKDTVITRASLEQFGRFLKTIGWRAIWSVNFAQGTIEQAVEEAMSVAAILGDSLLCLELGNEVEEYGNHVPPFRKPPYVYETYREEFNRWRDAIVKAVPALRFAAPDTAWKVEWVERMAKDARGDVQLLTTHYYFSGQKQGKAEDLLHTDPRLMEILVRLRKASAESGIPWRMCETNSFSGGGLRGVSDTFLGAIWTLDYMLLLAAHGCSGVNIETGVNQLGFVSSYSPITDDGHGNNRAGIPYYGMLAFAEARGRCNQIVALDAPPVLKGLTAYALGDAGRVMSAVVINRGESDARVSLKAIGLRGELKALRLTAPGQQSTTDATLGDDSVDENGRWRAKRWERVAPAEMLVPKMSAVIVQE
jgi:hypothetical protein